MDVGWWSGSRGESSDSRAKNADGGFQETTQARWDGCGRVTGTTDARFTFAGVAFPSRTARTGVHCRSVGLESACETREIGRAGRGRAGEE